MDWREGLPRKYYEKYKKVDITSEWYTVYQLPHNVYAITEPNHFQEVNSFLIIGESQALLLDTGMGFESIKDVCHQLYKGEIIVVNSHFHFDHITDNWRFDKVFSYNEEHALSQIGKGFTTKELTYQIGEEMFWGNPPQTLDLEHYHIPPVRTIPIEDGHIFDLGGRLIKVIHTPGHTNDSIVLLDEQSRFLFTGDTFYLGALYTHFKSDFYGYSNVGVYKETLCKLSKVVDKIDWLLCSHNDLMVKPIKIVEAYEAFEMIDNNSIEIVHTEAGLHEYEIVDSKISEYKFDGFSVVVRR